MKQFFTSLALILSTYACTNPQTQREGTVEHSEIRDTLPYRIETYVAVSPYFSQGDGSIDTTSFSITYPLFSDSAMHKLILQSVIEEGETLESLGESFLTGYQNYVEDATHPEHLHSWFQHFDVSLPLYTPSLVVLKKSFTEYTGGAHGNYATLYHNYDLIGQKEISLTEVLDADKKNEFLTIAEQYFREAEGISDSISLEEDYFFDKGVFAITENFALSPDGLHFYYNIYEIKAYAKGTTELIIPYTALRDVLSDYGKRLVQHIQTYHKITKP